jgi:hypothetical protein
MLTYLLFEKVGLLYGRVRAGPRAGAAGAASKFLPEPHKNDAAPQHWLTWHHDGVIMILCFHFDT